MDAGGETTLDGGVLEGTVVVGADGLAGDPQLGATPVTVIIAASRTNDGSVKLFSRMVTALSK